MLKPLQADLGDVLSATVVEKKTIAKLRSAISGIPECIAAGYVDLTTGKLFGIKTLNSNPHEVLKLLAAATAELFQGPNVTTIEKLFKKSRGLKDNNHHYFQEMIIMSDQLIHVFIRSKMNEERVLGIVCRKSANLGMVLTKVHQSLPMVETSV